MVKKLTLVILFFAIMCTVAYGDKPFMEKSDGLQIAQSYLSASTGFTEQTIEELFTYSVSEISMQGVKQYIFTYREMSEFLFVQKDLDLSVPLPSIVIDIEGNSVINCYPESTAIIDEINAAMGK